MLGQLKRTNPLPAPTIELMDVRPIFVRNVNPFPVAREANSFRVESRVVGISRILARSGSKLTAFGPRSGRAKNMSPYPHASPEPNPPSKFAGAPFSRL